MVFSKNEKQSLARIFAKETGPWSKALITT
jgi:hypothetical protein